MSSDGGKNRFTSYSNNKDSDVNGHKINQAKPESMKVIVDVSPCELNQPVVPVSSGRKATLGHVIKPEITHVIHTPKHCRKGCQPDHHHDSLHVESVSYVGFSSGGNFC